MRRQLLRIAALLAATLALLAVVVLARTLRFTSRQVAIAPATDLPAVSGDAVSRLARALRFPTVSHSDPTRMDESAFAGLRRHLEESFPEVHRRLAREVVGEHSLLFTWEGTTRNVPPILLLAHMDVVPADEGDLWTHPPFSGDIVDGAIWGRGTLDDKAGVLAILEAVETLLKLEVNPRRTVYLAFGHDEEVGGPHGAGAVAALLRSRGVRAEWLLDEGGAICEGLVPGVAAPVAFVGIAEKGFANVELAVETTGGHSSMPPAQTAVGILAAALARLEQEPMPGRLDGVARETFERLGPEMPLSSRLAFANLWLFEPLVRRRLSERPATDAALRTTTAATMISGGVAENVLPPRARAVVNARIRPGDRIQDVLDHVRQTVADPRVSIRILGDVPTEPSRVSRTDSPAFQLLQRTIREVFPGVVVAPTLTVAATDSHHYADLAADVYRFLPVSARPDDLARIHGRDERIQVADYKAAVRFYFQLIRAAAR
jgi:carboxypeptidase PM20D1